MFSGKYFGARFFGPRYWGKIGQDPPPPGTGVIQMLTLQAIGGTANP